MQKANRKEQRAKSLSHKAILASWLIILYLCLSACVLSYTLSVGHLPPLRNGRTFLLITDLSGAGPDVEISFYSEAGINVATFRKLLPPMGKIQIDIDNYLQTTGTIVLKSSNERIAGEYWQIYENRSMFMLPLQHPGEAGRYFVNRFRFPSCGSKILVLSDPHGSGPLVQMEFYSSTGGQEQIAKMESKLLRPHGTLAFEIDDYAPPDILGKVSIRSFGGSIVLHYRQLCRDKVVLAVPARLPARELIINEFSTDSKITGNLVITDTSGEGPVVEIQFLDDNGEVIAVQEKLLPHNGALDIDPADYVDNVTNGVMKISGETEIMADYWEKNTQTVLHTPAVSEPDGDLFISHFSPFDDTQDVLSLLNVGKEPVKVKIQFYSDDGKELGSEELFLEPYKQIDKLVGHYFARARPGTMIVSGANASLVVTSHIFDLKNTKHLGTAYAQVIR